MSKQCFRAGFTLIDLLASIVIVVMLLVLGLPAVEQNREVAQRHQCINKMKQLGLALHNHHDVYKRFPAASNQGSAAGVASVWWPLPGSGSGEGAAPSAGYTTDAGTTRATASYSWTVKILPFLDAALLYNTISQASLRFTADAFTPYDVEAASDGEAAGQTFSVTTNVAGAKTIQHFAAVELDQFACPSYSGSRTVAMSRYQGKRKPPPENYGFPAGSDKLGSPAQFAAITNYVALSATHFSCLQYAKFEKLAATTVIPPDAEVPNGMIVPGVGLNMRSCTDGTSTTLMVCETIEPAVNCWYDGTTTWTTAINPNSVAGNPPSKADPTAAGAPNPAHYWIEPAGGSTALNVGPDPDAEIAYSPGLAGYCATPQILSWGPSSQHAGGLVIHLEVDGATRAISSKVDPTLYMHLITRAGHEPIAMPDGRLSLMRATSALNWR